MASHMELLTELQFLDKVTSLERLRAAQKRRNQQLKKWAQYEKEMQSKKRKPEKKKEEKKNTANRKRVSFAANITLLESSVRNDINEVRHLLKKKINPDLCNEDGLTALHQCCIDDFEDIAKLLLNHGANVNAKDNELWTPLHAASICAHMNLVKILIQYGADLLAVNADGNMPYDLCDDDPTLDLIETEMANRGITQEQINEVRAATERRMVLEIQDAVKEGHDLNQTDLQGATLLHIAAANGYLQAAEVLLEHGANVDMKDPDGWQPLHAAACWGQIQLAELLVSHGASLNAKTLLDETPIDLCDDEELRSALLELKHKHDIIMKSQLKHKSSLSRRSSSTGSRGKVVRRASLSDRTNLYKKEYEKEAIVWQQMGKKADEKELHSSDGEERETQSDQENKDPNMISEKMPSLQADSTDSKKPKETSVDILLQNGDMAPNHASEPVNGDLLKTTTTLDVPDNQAVADSRRSSQEIQQPWSNPRERSHQTLSELKKQRAAAKLFNHPLLNGHLGNGVGGLSESNGESKTNYLANSRTSTYGFSGTPVYYTATSGETPILKLKAPVEEMDEKVQGCCKIS
ncbi:protein phosphatase 1 regulatory inhibitor subunit 16B [Latimeria chalumnae]|uniref:Protein phosphatase 1 regulatory inhibitor subunit 16B n=1 Tax=Latimeria chalumnae TaxID=7897 RepID=H3B4Q8_LATCH|nr:PREDICTED: protein phosphatase 1 regulatory inhibitor subunit 16B [Latimeria chalumnae]|eukprot:XP_014340718.1 PREDICTED: protein phosphatase 1 regulatory inhibitor subunit 16B [Latimeria chalumnae]